MDFGNLLHSVISNVEKKAQEIFQPVQPPVNHNPLQSVVQGAESFGSNAIHGVENTVGSAVNSFLHPSYTNTQQTPYVSPVPTRQLQMPKMPDYGAVGNFFDPNHAGQDRFNFWNTPVAKGLGALEQFTANPPKLDLEQAAGNIANPFVRVPAQFGAGVVDNLANTPANIVQSGNRIGTDVRTGRITQPLVAVGDVAAAADPLLNIATLGGGTFLKGIGEQAAKDIGEQGLKQVAENQLKMGAVNSLPNIIKHGALEGAKFGALFGGLQGLSEGDQADLKKGLVGMLQGGLLGGVLGGGTAGLSGFFSKLNKVHEKFGLPKDVARKEKIGFVTRGGYVRDIRNGRFASKDQPTLVVNYKGRTWASVNKTLGRPADTPVTPEDFDRAVNIEMGLPENPQLPQPGLSIKMVGSDALHQIGRNTATIDKNANFAATDGIEQSLRGALSSARSAKDEVNIINGFVDNQIKSAGNPTDLKATRAALNRELKGIVGDTGNYKGDFAMQQTMKDDPMIGPRINALEDAIVKVDQALKQPPAQQPSVTNAGVVDINKLPAKAQFKVGDVLDPLGNTNMVGPVKISSIEGNTLKFVDANGTEYSGMPRSTVRRLIDGGSWKRVAPPSDNLTTPLSSEGVITKKGKIKVKNMPTQAEIKNRAEVNFGNPDLHTQRTQKLEQAGIITPEERASMQDFEQNVLGKTNNQMGEQVNESTQSTINPGQKTPLSEAKLPNPDHVTPADYVRSAETRRPIKDSQGQKVDTSLSNIIDSSGFDVKKKVNMLDYFRTPDRVLQKIGLGKEAAQLRGAYDGYLKELPQEIDRVTQWSKQVPPEENQSLFRYLDGQAPKSSLSPQTQKVAGQIKAYLGQWADRLGLPEDKRITNYITHIFDKEGFTKEIDPDLAKIIRDKVAGSVYDPFTEKRLGALGYKEDTWAALDAYVKRATRKVNMDPVLNTISQKAENLEESQFDYVKKYIAGVNMQPTKIDNLIDNTIKQVVGYKFGARPVTYLTKTLRQAGFRGSLGLNVGSALRNLTQGVNTYAKLGEKYTTVGYAKLAKAMATGDKELEDQGILRNDFVQDRTISAKKQVIQKMDKGLFSLFELAEKINRGSAYFGAKAKYLAEHKNASEQDAINYAKDIVAKTQFNFGQVDSPAVLRSDIAKTLGQFQSYNVKQAEFLGEMVKNKEFAGLARYTIGTLALATIIGKLFGMKPTDMIPFSGVLTGQTKLGQTPAINAVEQTATALTPGAKDKYGNPLTLQDRAGMIGNAVIPLIPAGVQAKKTFQGLQTVGQGYAANASGNVQIPMQQNVGNFVRGALFGKSYLPGVQDYYNSGNKPLSKDQSALFKQLPTQGRQDFFNQTMTDRQQNKVIDKITSGSTQPSTVKGAQPASFTIQDKQINGYQVGDKYVYKDDSSGKWKTASVSDVQKGQLTYAEDLAGSQMTAAKNADDINAWVDAAKVQYASLQKQLQDPSLSKLDKLKLQNKVDSLTSQMEKYLGYGGFTKPKKAKFKTPTFVPLNVNAHTNNALFQKTATLQAPRMPIQNVRFNVPSVQMPQGNLSVPDFKARVKFNL